MTKTLEQKEKAGEGLLPAEDFLAAADQDNFSRQLLSGGRFFLVRNRLGRRQGRLPWLCMKWH